MIRKRRRCAWTLPRVPVALAPLAPVRMTEVRDQCCGRDVEFVEVVVGGRSFGVVNSLRARELRQPINRAAQKEPQIAGPRLRISPHMFRANRRGRIMALSSLRCVREGGFAATPEPPSRECRSAGNLTG